MRPLRVAYLPASLRPGGAERQMLALAERLPKDRFTVEFIAITGAGEYDERAETAGARVRSLGVPATSGDSIPTKSFKRVAKIVRYATVARSATYDIIDAWLYPSDVLAALARPFTRTPIIISGRRNIDPQRQFRILERPVGALVHRGTDMVVANSAAAAAFAIANQRIDPTRVRIIRNGVVIPTLATAAERGSIRHELGVADGEILIGCVANYRDVKRLDLLITSFAQLVAEGLPVRLELIGEVTSRPALEAQIRDAGIEHVVCLHGSVPSAERLYPAFDVVVQSSDGEGLPNALLEASAAGRAIVATAAGGTEEIVTDGTTGLLVRIGDQDGLTAAIRREVVDPELRGRLGAAARSHVATAFSIDRFVGEFADLYESLAAEKHLRG
jgi:glycosyltransferase involved in cell wall biosynthesis